MPIETLDDIVEELADKFGIYGVEIRNEFTENWKQRVRRACDVERRLGLQRGHDVKEFYPKDTADGS